MKKTIAIFFVVCIVSSLLLCSCATETNSRFVGEYTGEAKSYIDSSRLDGSDCMVEISTKMVLEADGSGYYESKVSDANDSQDFENGYLTSRYDLKWRVEDEYLIIDYNGKKYTRESGFNSFPYPDGEYNSYSVTYELKANLLFKLGEDRARFRKIS